MALPGGLSAAEWCTQRGVVLASQHLREELDLRYPGISALAAQDPLLAVDSVPDVEVRWTAQPPKGACELGGVYDGDREPALITIRRYANDSRNYFTCLHELGHHLFALDETWQYGVLPLLGEHARRTEDKIVNDFAASLLIPEDRVVQHLGSGVTARGIVALVQQTQASATSCCVRALHRPGERLIMLADHGGHIWWADANGSPFNPGKRVHQPSLVRAIERAADDGGEHTVVGGDGIRYSSGKAITDVRVEVALHEGLAVAVVTSTHPQTRHWVDSQWEETCGACGTEFQISKSPGHCAKCDTWKCPDCRACECAAHKPVYCMKCFMQMSLVESAGGRTEHDECP